MFNKKSWAPPPFFWKCEHCPIATSLQLLNVYSWLLLLFVARFIDKSLSLCLYFRYLDAAQLTQTGHTDLREDGSPDRGAAQRQGEEVIASGKCFNSCRGQILGQVICVHLRKVSSYSMAASFDLIFCQSKRATFFNYCCKKSSLSPCFRGNLDLTFWVGELLFAVKNKDYSFSSS